MTKVHTLFSSSDLRRAEFRIFTNNSAQVTFYRSGHLDRYVECRTREEARALWSKLLSEGFAASTC